MATEFLRDTLFDTAWFGLMSVVWFGWAQERPPRGWPARLGVGSVLSLLLTFGFGILVALNWEAASAMSGREAWFGVLVGAEVVLAGVACLVL